MKKKTTLENMVTFLYQPKNKKTKTFFFDGIKTDRQKSKETNNFKKELK